MRDLATSMIRFSWAMSMLGARQAANLIAPRDGWKRSTDAFDSVSQAAADEMGESLKGFYQAGDRLQRGMIDSMSKFFGGNWSEPGKVMNETWEALDRTWTDAKEDLSTDPPAEE